MKERGTVTGRWPPRRGHIQVITHRTPEVKAIRDAFIGGTMRSDEDVAAQLIIDLLDGKIKSISFDTIVQCSSDERQAERVNRRVVELTMQLPKLSEYPGGRLQLPTSIHPKDVPGHHYSCVLRTGWRLYFFTDGDDREAAEVKYKDQLPKETESSSG